MVRIMAVCLFVFSLCACSKEDPNPEFNDPIYKDLKAITDGHQKAVDEAKKRKEELEISLEKAEPNSMDMKDLRKEYAKTKSSIHGHTQLARFYKIRTDRRAVVDKISAKEARLAKKDWPERKEYADYLINKRLHEINLNWNSRVPKLQDRTKAQAKGKKQAEGEGEQRAPASKGGH